MLAPASVDHIPATESVELFRYFSMKRQGLLSVRSDGTTWRQMFDGSWSVLARKKPDVQLERWTEAQQQMYAQVQPWQRAVSSLPTAEDFEEWAEAGSYMTPTGHSVEPDGEGPDGVPSWLRVLGII